MAALLLAPIAAAQEEVPGGKTPSSDSSTAATLEEPASGAEPEGSPTNANPASPVAEVAPDAESGAEPQASSAEDAADGSTGDAADDSTDDSADDSVDDADDSLDADTDIDADIDPSSPEAVEEFLVTARKIEILAPDTTISVVGFDPEDLKAEGIKDIRDLSAFTPSLEIKSAFAASNPTIFIRGVGLDDYNANAASAVAIYQDGVYMQSPAGQLFQFFDVERVEVLRGPQPTLFRNAEAGAILVNSREPTDEFDAYLTGTYGSYDLYEVEGAVGGPIVPGLLSGRVSASWGIRDGITENRCAAPLRPNGTRSTARTCNLSQTQDPANLKFQHGMEEWTNDLDAYAGRGQLLLQLPLGETDTQWLLNVHGGQNRSRALQYQHRGVSFESATSEVPVFGRGDVSGYKDEDGDPFAGDYNLDGPEDISLFGANLRGSWRFGDESEYELRSLTAYEWHDRFTKENSDANPKYMLESEYVDKAWQLSQELNLRGHWGSLIGEIGDGDWIVGAYYLQETLDVGNFFDTAEVNVAQHLSQEYTQKTRNFAAYAQSEYRFRPGCTLIPCDFTLIGGIRYNIEYKSFDTFVCETGEILCDRETLEGTDDARWTAPSGEVSLAWNFNEESSLYVKYSRGWKGGHFNGGATSIFDIITGVEPETVDSYEGGLRSYWFDGRLMLNATGFYYDYQNLQVFIIQQTPLGYPIPKLVNASDAVVYGVEVDLGAQPLPGLNLTYNFAWVESEYLDFVVSFIEVDRPPKPCRACPPPPPVLITRRYNYTANPLIASPRYSMTGTVEYTLPLPGTLFGRSLGSLTPRFSFSWKDEMFFDACSGRGTRCNFPVGYFGEQPYWVYNAALTWRSEDERFELMGWVHNLLDQHYKTQNFDLSRDLGVILDAYAEPRTFGITATISF
jgi:iron complex outermembrane receptor protein